MLGACAVPVVEDDYSVPYEVKKLFRGKTRGKKRQQKPNIPFYLIGCVFYSSICLGRISCLRAVAIKMVWWGLTARLF